MGKKPSRTCWNETGGIKWSWNQEISLKNGSSATRLKKLLTWGSVLIFTPSVDIVEFSSTSMGSCLILVTVVSVSSASSPPSASSSSSSSSSSFSCLMLVGRLAGLSGLSLPGSTWVNENWTETMLSEMILQFRHNFIIPYAPIRVRFRIRLKVKHIFPKLLLLQK